MELSQEARDYPVPVASSTQFWWLGENETLGLLLTRLLIRALRVECAAPMQTKSL